MADMSVPCHEGPPATKGHFSSEPAVAGRDMYYCSYKFKKNPFINIDLDIVDFPISFKFSLFTK